MNSLSILAIKHSPVSFKAEKPEASEKPNSGMSNKLYSEHDNQFFKNEKAKQASMILPGAGQFQTGKIAQGSLFAGIEVLNLGLAGLGLVKLMKPITKATNMHSKLLRGVGALVLMATSALISGVNRYTSVMSLRNIQEPMLRAKEDKSSL